MATCANCIHHSLCDYNTNISGNGKVRLVYSDGADVKCSFFQNTADVVPKSEVESLKAELEDRVYTINMLVESLEKAKSDADRWRRNLEAVLEERAEEKTEVAREIFEEIESKKIFLKYHTGKIGVVVTLKDIAELKKKYTEDKT